MKLSQRAKYSILLGTIVVVLIGTIFVPPVPQDALYHRFADQRKMLGIPNFWNVITNIPFFFIGLIGIGLIQLRKMPGGLSEIRIGYLTFFIGMVGVAFGSSYYHLNPSNQTLFWDRLPMTIAFMAFCSVIVGEYLSIELGRRLLWPLVGIGFLSVIYWAYTQGLGRGDLRPYAIVQFLPGLLIPMVLLMFRSAFTSSNYIWGMLASYILAKVAEALDGQIFDVLGVISGHSIKHLIAAVGGILFCLALRDRQAVGPVARHPIAD
jgi:hypothetical protein